MYPAMTALGLTSIMICIGMFLRAKIPFFRKMFAPVSVIAGILGFIFMNAVPREYILNSVPDAFSTVANIFFSATPDVFSQVVNILFTISFICIALVDNSSGKDKKAKKLSNDGKKQKSSGLMKGAIGMGLIWCALYSITPVVGYYLIKLIGEPFGMQAELGLLIPFGFCQGPGQAVSFGLTFENEYGVAGSTQVAMAFAAVGFLSAFFVGVPMAKIAIKKKIAKNAGEVNASVEKGIFAPEEQTESVGKVTTHSGSLDTLACHFAVIGVCYMLALVISWALNFIPVIGSSFSNMLFFCGMFAAYIVKAVMKKFKIFHVLDNSLLNKLTGWTSDYLVVMAFMAVELKAVGTWLVPIMIESVLVTIVTFFICVYFGQRFGGENDLERTLGLYGTATGTTPSGVALVRIVDPNLVTTTGSELGMMNITMMLSSPAMILMILGMTNVLPMNYAMIGMTLCGVLFIILLKPFGVWRKPTYKFSKGRMSDGDEIADTSELVEDVIRVATEEAEEHINDKDFPGIIK